MNAHALLFFALFSSFSTIADDISNVKAPGHWTIDGITHPFEIDFRAITLSGDDMKEFISQQNKSFICHLFPKKKGTKGFRFLERAVQFEPPKLDRKSGTAIFKAKNDPSIDKLVCFVLFLGKERGYDFHVHELIDAFGKDREGKPRAALRIHKNQLAKTDRAKGSQHLQPRHYISAPRPRTH